MVMQSMQTFFVCYLVWPNLYFLTQSNELNSSKLWWFWKVKTRKTKKKTGNKIFLLRVSCRGDIIKYSCCTNKAGIFYCSLTKAWKCCESNINLMHLRLETMTWSTCIPITIDGTMNQWLLSKKSSCTRGSRKEMC